MRDIISNLKLKLAQTEEDVSCPAIYRLRAKLRDLMKGQTNLGENDHLLAEIDELRRGLGGREKREVVETRAMDTATVPEYADVSDLLKKLNDCEDVVGDLERKLEEKDDKVSKSPETVARKLI